MTTRVLKNHQLPVQIEGFPYIVGGLILTSASFMVLRGAEIGQAGGASIWGFSVAAGLFTLFTLFSIWFYRNPDRVTPQDTHAVFSPADGHVLKVDEVAGTRIGEQRAKRISIFMSPMDVHVNRSPMNGKIEAIQYNKGKFFKADLDKASEENEHNWVVLKTDLGPKVAFVQIAGFIARRIVCYVQSGERLKSGERFGMIRFGSRMEILVPTSATVLVKPGEKTLSGVTALARLP